MEVDAVPQRARHAAAVFTLLKSVKAWLAKPADNPAIQATEGELVTWLGTSPISVRQGGNEKHPELLNSQFSLKGIPETACLITPSSLYGPKFGMVSPEIQVSYLALLR